MFISNFGITLSRLTLEDIELVRYWRNSKEISKFMEYKKFITEEQQKKWFESLDELCDFYFLINWNGQKIGMIHTSTIDWKEKTAHAGLFIWHRDYLGTHIPVLASLAMLECFFGDLNLETYFAKVGRENKVAINYNKALGFKLFSQSSDSDFDLYKLEKEEYNKATVKLKKFATTVSAEKPKTEINKKLLAEIEKVRN